MRKSLLLRIAPETLEKVISTLDVKFVALSQCYVSSGYRLELPGSDTPGIHYNLFGTGKIRIGDAGPVDLLSRTMIIVPAGVPLAIEASPLSAGPNALRVVRGGDQKQIKNKVRQIIAGETSGEIGSQINLICGFFHVTYGSATDLFESLTFPIIEQFPDVEELEQKLGIAMEELAADKVGGTALGATLAKQVLVTLLRRSLTSLNSWVETFSSFADPRIARAFAAMAADPGADHTVMSLAEIACLSKSSFMSRFSHLFGRPPIAILRELRMRQAFRRLEEGEISFDKIINDAGYQTRDRFTRAFRQMYDMDPARLYLG